MFNYAKIKNSIIKSIGCTENLSLYTLCLLLVINPFHFFFFGKFVYYREMISLFFCLFCYIQYTTDKKILNSESGVELISFLIFPVILVLFAFIDSGRHLYELDITQTSLNLKTINPTIYILRNALLYLPIVIYFTLTGLSETNIRKVALLTVVVAPVSIFAFIYFHKLATFNTFWVLSTLAGAGMQYNTYIPYLTFSALSAIYLLNTVAISNKIKFLAFSVLVFISIYLLFATSRQSILFILLCGLVFLAKNREVSLTQKLIVSFLYILTTWIILKIIVNGFSWDYLYWNNWSMDKLKNHLFSDFSVLDYSRAGKMSSIKTPRWEIIQYGFSLLSPFEYITGAGLTSVINSGPHNDFVRWIQRIGIFGMLTGFYSFGRAFINISRIESRMNKHNALQLYLFLAISFTLYHSLFGYPREDAYQAVYCFLGLSLYLGYKKRYILEDEKYFFTPVLLHLNWVRKRLIMELSK